MNSPQPSPPQFLPTLTEIVQPGELEMPAAMAVSTPQDRLQSALQQLDRVIEQRVREELDALVRTLVAEQIETLQRRLHEEFQSVLREAAVQAPEDPKSRPELK